MFIRTTVLFYLAIILVMCWGDSSNVPSKRTKQRRQSFWKKFWNRGQNKEHVVGSIVSSLNLTALPYDPETTMNPVQIIVNRGYSVASYSVTTDDGYILELHRIPYGKGHMASNGTGKPVLLQHGLLGSSANWLIVPSNHSLAFRLADLGYDVWLGNIRGNTYSRKHLNMNPASHEAYWKFSWDEMGKYDVPAILNFILSKTGHDKLIYIGHSMGCSMFFVAMSTYPELGSKIELMIALAPAVSLGHSASPVMRTLAPFVKQVEFLFRLFRVRHFASNDSHFSYQLRRFCQRNTLKAGICRNILFYIVGDNPETIDLNLLPVIDGHTPSGTSIHTLAHFAMNHNSGQTFIHYDHGMIGNYLRYGQFRPPPYDLSKVSPPVYLFYGPNDLLVRPSDVAWLADQLPNVKELVRVDSKYYNHLDFLWEKNNNELLYDRLISILPPPT